MGILTKFLKDQGLITDDAPVSTPSSKKAEVAAKPVNSTFLTTTFNATGLVNTTQPTPQVLGTGQQPKDAFVKFFEDAMTAANLPGEDYYEFRTKLSKMKQRMGNRTSEDAILESVLIEFESKNLFAKDLVGFADHYLQALTAKKDQFIHDAEGEKVNIQKNREASILQAQNDIAAKEQQIAQMNKSIETLQQGIDQQKNSIEVTKSSIQEAYDKIDVSKQELQLAFDFMASNITNEKSILLNKVQ